MLLKSAWARLRLSELNLTDAPFLAIVDDCWYPGSLGTSENLKGWTNCHKISRAHFWMVATCLIYVVYLGMKFGFW